MSDNKDTRPICQATGNPYPNKQVLQHHLHNSVPSHMRNSENIPTKDYVKSFVVYDGNEEKGRKK
jgi:hypothetical protein